MRTIRSTKGSWNPRLMFACTVLGFCCTAPLASSGHLSSANAIPQSTSNCVACHRTTGDEVGLYEPSVHAAAGISCSRCHGGNVSATNKEAAHSGRFVGKLTSSQAIATCGTCHSSELATFKTSKHFPEKKGVARLDCVQCHGAHTIGSPSRNFSYAYFCSGCHGLEYLPELNRPFQQMLEAADGQNDAINAIRTSGAKPSDQLLSLRKQTRKMIAEIVHGTDYQAGQDKIPGILQINEQFKKLATSKR